MTHVSDITLYVAPPSTAEIGPAYVRLVLGVAQRVPGLLHTYLGPTEWLNAVSAESPSLATLRHHAVAVATATQKSDLPRNRRERILRNVRALLWLIRAQENERLIFSEQVRMLLDLKPEGVDEAFFQTAHDTLSAALPGAGPPRPACPVPGRCTWGGAGTLARVAARPGLPALGTQAQVRQRAGKPGRAGGTETGPGLAERWADWQATYSLPATTALPLLAEALDTLRAWPGAAKPLTEGDIKLVETGGNGSLSYQQGELHVPREATLRVDRLYHLAARWGYGGAHSVYTAMARRYANGEGDVECAVILNLGPDQVIAQGLPLALLSELDLYSTAIPAMLRAAGLPDIASQQLQAIHVVEDALQWGLANAALLLHGEGLRPRAMRHRLMANALLPLEATNRILEGLADPVRAVHVFAPLIGGPLVKAWLAQEEHSVSTLLFDPPVPSTLVFEVRFAD
jgi:hypothetical protein